MKRLIFILLITLAGVILSALIFVHFFITGTRVAEYANELIGEEYHVQITEASLNLFSRSLNLEGITVLTANGDKFIEANEFLIRNIGIIEAFRGNIWVKNIVIRDFYLDQKLISEGIEEEEEEEEEGVKLELEEEESSVSIFLESAELQNGIIVFAAGVDGDGELRGLNVRAGPVNHIFGGNNNRQNPEIENISVDISEAEYIFWENRYRAAAHSIVISEEDSLLKTGIFTLKSTMPIEDFYETLEYRTDHFSVDLSGFAIKKIDFPGLKNGKQFASAFISLDSLDLHVTNDKRLPRDPEKEIPSMPMEALYDAQLDILIDSLIVRRADIRYSEYDEEGVRPGTVLFARTSAVITPVYSNSAGPVVMTAKSFLENSGELDVEIQLSMDEGMSVTRVEGSLGRFDATLLNNIFVDLEGIRIKNGMVYRADFMYTMKGEQAEGVFRIHYDELSVEAVDRVDHSQGFRNRLKGFFMDKIAIRESSGHNGEDFREGEISEEQEPEKGFFNYLWVSLRSGLMDAISRI